MFKLIAEARKHGAKCNSVCCSGSFIVETMLSVLVNEDVRELRFDQNCSKFWNMNHVVQRYVPYQVPAILSHYSQSLIDTEEYKNPQLERLVVNGTDIFSKKFQGRNHHITLLKSYNETNHYLEIPRALSKNSSEGNDFRGNADDLSLALELVFTSPYMFYKLTEIVLGNEALHTMNNAGHKSHIGARPTHVELFSQMGLRCPNLRVLDISSCINVCPEVFFYLCFRHAYSELHPYTWMPGFQAQDDGYILQTTDQVIGHDPDVYCPRCRDDWAPNVIRNGNHVLDSIRPLDDRLYDEIMDVFPQDVAKRALSHVIKISDAIRASKVEGVLYLERPAGPLPGELGWVEPSGDVEVQMDFGWEWYMPKKVRYVRREPDYPILNDITRSLRMVLLNIDAIHPKVDIIPFLLSVMPQLKSLGRGDVVRGLKMIRDIPGLHGISAENMESMEFTFGDHDSNTIDAYWAGDSNWANYDVLDFVLDFPKRQQELDPEPELLEDKMRWKKRNLSEDVRLVAESCPRLMKIRVALFGDYPYLNETDHKVWEPFEKRLLNLRWLRVVSHDWTQVRTLVEAVGQRLTNLYLALMSMKANLDRLGERLPSLELVFNICPRLEEVTLSFSLRAVQVSEDVYVDAPQTPYPSLQTCHIHTYITKKAFRYLWARGQNLTTIKIGSVVDSDIFPRNHEAQLEFDENDVLKMIRHNKMRHLIKFHVDIRFKNIECAKLFLSHLSPQTKEIGTLKIRVGLESEDLEAEELYASLARVLASMNNFMEFVTKLSKQNNQQVSFQWEKFGFLESLPDSGPMQNFLNVDNLLVGR